MPSELGKLRGRRLDPSGERSRQGQSELSNAQPIPIRPPWGGYCPDIGPAIATWEDAESIDGLANMGSILGPPPGYVRLDSDSLPLGAATPPSAAGDERPVVGIFAYRDSLVAGGTNRRYAVTAGAPGRLYELSGNWTNIPAAATTLTGDTSGAGIAQTLCDFASFPADNRVILANGFDVVFYHTPGGANYVEFSPAVRNPFKAKSCCGAFDRIFFLNTSESGTVRPFRLTYTTRGASAALTGLGSGQIDFLEPASEGVAVRRLGNFLAVYFRKGVAILRETGNVFDPFAREYVSTTRGLIGTFAVTDLGLGQHFGIFSDGWFILTDTGQFVEVGIRQVGLGRFPKWRRTFYSQLNTQKLDRVSIQYDRLFRIVWIVWPDTTSDHPNRVWMYDLDTDTVWPLDGVFTTFPNILQLFTSLSDTLSYSAAASLTYSSETRSYVDFEVREGAELIAYGTRDGLVMTQDRRLITIDGVTPSYSWQSYQLDLQTPSLVKVFNRLDFTYRQQAALAGPNINITFRADNQDEQRSIPQNFDPSIAQRSNYATSRLSGTTLGFGISGQHPAEFVALQAEILSAGKIRKPIV